MAPAFLRGRHGDGLWVVGCLLKACPGEAVPWELAFAVTVTSGWMAARAVFEEETGSF